jgi:hypothetical protein
MLPSTQNTIPTQAYETQAYWLTTQCHSYGTAIRYGRINTIVTEEYPGSLVGKKVYY